MSMFLPGGAAGIPGTPGANYPVNKVRPPLGGRPGLPIMPSQGGMGGLQKLLALMSGGMNQQQMDNLEAGHNPGGMGGAFARLGMNEAQLQLLGKMMQANPTPRDVLPGHNIPPAYGLRENWLTNHNDLMADRLNNHAGASRGPGGGGDGPGHLFGPSIQARALPFGQAQNHPLPQGGRQVFQKGIEHGVGGLQMQALRKLQAQSMRNRRY